MRLRRYVKLNFVIYATPLTVLCCGAPLGPMGYQWRVAGEIPLSIGRPSAISVNREGVYFVCRAGPKPNIVYKYENGRFKAVYEGPADVTFYDVDGGESGGWAVGATETGEGVIIKRTGDSWAAVAIPRNIYNAFLRVIDINGEECWLSASRPGGKELIFFNGEEIIPFPTAGRPDFLAYAVADGAIYAYSLPGNAINLSVDGGVSWAHEKLEIVLPAGPGGGDVDVIAMAAGGTRLFIAFRTKNAGRTVYGVAVRSGTPGRGVYTPIFYSPQGPYFATISDVAFRSEGEGLAVGSWTSVFYEAPNWVLEDAEPYNYYLAEEDPESGWWAVADTHVGRALLLYHP